MDWGLFRPSRATLLCFFLLGISFLLMVFRLTSAVRGLRSVLFYWLVPTQETADATLQFAGGLSRNLVELVRAHNDNRVYRERIKALSVLEIRYRELEMENVRLRALLQLKASEPYEVQAAFVSGRDAQTWMHAVWVDRGAQEGVLPDSPVLALSEGFSTDSDSGTAKGGVVGRVLECGPHTSKVLLLSDPLSSIAVVLPRSGEQGLVQGQGSFLATVEYLDPMADVQPGDEAVTSGLGGIFPPGLPVGKLERLEVSSSGFRRATIRPAVSMSRLREVLILKKGKSI